MSEFGQRLRLRRLAAGFAHARDCAKLLDIHENRYSRYERGDAEPAHDLLLRICQLLQTSPNELFGFDTSVGGSDAVGDGTEAGRSPGFDEPAPAPWSGAGAQTVSPSVPPLEPRSRPAALAVTAPPARASAIPAADLCIWSFAEAYTDATRTDNISTSPTARLVAVARLFNDVRRDPLAQIAGLITDDALQQLPAAEHHRVAAAAEAAIGFLLGRPVPGGQPPQSAGAPRPERRRA